MKPDESEIYQSFDRLLRWSDEIRKLGVRTNADTPTTPRWRDGLRGRNGLCRHRAHVLSGRAKSWQYAR